MKKVNHSEGGKNIDLIYEQFQKIINKLVNKKLCQFVRIHMNFFRFFSNLRNFFFSPEKTIKSQNLVMFSQKD